MQRRWAPCFLALFFLIAADCPAADKVVVIPLNTSNSSQQPARLWGEGRPGTILLNQYPAVNGIKIRKSYGTASWGAVAAACPRDAWVCTLEEVQDLDTSILTDFGKGLYCNGTSFSPSFAWVQDGYNLDGTQGIAASVVDFFGTYYLEKFYRSKCEQLQVWCCSVAQ